MWYQCYHSSKYPVTSFVHIDNEPVTDDSIRNISFQQREPNANSTMIETGAQSPDQMPISRSSTDNENSFLNSPSRQDHQNSECTSYSVGHISHIPRRPPTPATFTVPSIVNKSVQSNNDQDIFGMIKLGDDDVCYTSGTIEWVGRKRSFPLNSGFKILNKGDTTEPFSKRKKQMNVTYTNGISKINECDCADVLPTVNAIVDHLNALHEAVDLVDLRLNTLEEVVNTH